MEIAVIAVVPNGTYMGSRGKKRSEHRTEWMVGSNRFSTKEWVEEAKIYWHQIKIGRENSKRERDGKKSRCGKIHGAGMDHSAAGGSLHLLSIQSSIHSFCRNGSDWLFRTWGEKRGKWDSRKSRIGRHKNNEHPSLSPFWWSFSTTKQHRQLSPSSSLNSLVSSCGIWIAVISTGITISLLLLISCFIHRLLGIKWCTVSVSGEKEREWHMLYYCGCCCCPMNPQAAEPQFISLFPNLSFDSTSLFWYPRWYFSSRSILMWIPEGDIISGYTAWCRRPSLDLSLFLYHFFSQHPSRRQNHREKSSYPKIFTLLWILSFALLQFRFQKMTIFSDDESHFFLFKFPVRQTWFLSINGSRESCVKSLSRRFDTETTESQYPFPPLINKLSLSAK